MKRIQDKALLRGYLMTGQPEMLLKGPGRPSEANPRGGIGKKSAKGLSRAVRADLRLLRAYVGLRSRA